MDQDGVALFELAALKLVEPHRHERFQYGGRFHHLQAFGEAQRVALSRDTVFGVTTPWNQCADKVAGLEPADATADSRHFSSDLQPRNVRDTRRGIVQPFALKYVWSVDRCRAIPD
ncbi:hypothetical protein CS8_050130 [Cupriavidus sp. 8B]